jgi:hypothetical protein
MYLWSRGFPRPCPEISEHDEVENPIIIFGRCGDAMFGGGSNHLG